MAVVSSPGEFQNAQYLFFIVFGNVVFQELKCPFYVPTFALVSLRNEAKLVIFLTNEKNWLFSFFSVILGPKRKKRSENP